MDRNILIFFHLLILLLPRVSDARIIHFSTLKSIMPETTVKTTTTNVYFTFATLQEGFALAFLVEMRQVRWKSLLECPEGIQENGLRIYSQSLKAFIIQRFHS